MEKISVISTIISIISIGTAIYAVYLSRKTYRLQSARPHSERIGKEFSESLPYFSSSILDPRNLPDGGPEYYKIYSKVKEFPIYLRQHLESGYSEIYGKYKNWVDSVNLFNNHLINFVEHSVKEIKKNIEKEKDKNNLSFETVYEYRIISYSFKRILLPNFPEIEYSKSTFENLTKPQELCWKGALLIKGHPLLCIEVEKYIKDFLSSKKQKVLDFFSEFEKLQMSCNRLAEELRAKIIDKAKYGGIIQGKCDACC